MPKLRNKSDVLFYSSEKKGVRRIKREIKYCTQLIDLLGKLLQPAPHITFKKKIPGTVFHH